jgi:hypothetical protein
MYLTGLFFSLARLAPLAPSPPRAALHKKKSSRIRDPEGFLNKDV